MTTALVISYQRRNRLSRFQRQVMEFIRDVDFLKEEARSMKPTIDYNTEGGRMYSNLFYFFKYYHAVTRDNPIQAAAFYREQKRLGKW